MSAYLVTNGTVATTASAIQLFNANQTSRVIALTAGSYQFDIVAINAVGDSVASAKSNTVVAR